ncbi:MAG: flippase, partial [Solirubrobacterales bacterium]
MMEESGRAPSPRIVETMRNTLTASWRRNRRVIGNFFSLSIVQFANYMAPLILIPYLTRVLGLPRYGLVELARAISVYFLTLTDYGFSLSATQEVSVHRDDPKKVSEVFSSVMVLRLLLVLLSAVVLSAAVFVSPKLRADWPVYYLSFLSVVGMWLFPLWLFQGLERMKHIAALTVAAKFLVIVLTFIVVRESEDYLYVPLLQSAGTIVLGLTGLIFARRAFSVRFRPPSIAMLKHEFLNGWHVFVSKMAAALYTTSNIVILGLLTDNLFVAYFSPAEKIVRAATDGLLVPLSQAIFPHISRLASQSRAAALRFAGKVAGLMAAVTFVISIALLLGADAITRLALGREAPEGATVIRILSFLPLIAGLNNTLGVQILVAFGLKRLLARITVAAGVVNIGLALLLAPSLKHAGVAVGSLATEICILIAVCVALWRHGLSPFGARDKDV